ncbi:MAG: DUF547 domain-containing protein [Ignavibacteriales bacterium]|nr:DUF547 domain-containing protein [Ignavibacteriales bacterium]
MAQRHQLFTDILHLHIKNGLVDYKKLQNDRRLEEYLTQLQFTDPSKLSREEKLAYWINAYNAFTLKAIVDAYPVKSINDLHSGGLIIGSVFKSTIWDKDFIVINKKKYSLGYIEHKILRKMKEPRIHFAIVCASISCPTLRDEAFEADKIYEQLQSQATQFINDNTRNYFDMINRESYLSKIFNWFSEDFGESDENVLKYIIQYLPEKVSLDILNNLSRWDISYKDYNWNLNEQK